MKESFPYLKRPLIGAVPGLRSERGAALLLVVWVGTFFSIVLSSFAFSMRTELAAAKNFKEREEAYGLARAGITRAIAELVRGLKPPETSLPASRLYDSGSIPLGRGNYRVTVSDEQSRISLNSAAPAMLRRLLRNNGVTDSRLLDTIVDSILDWRDADDLHHLSGAEAEHYGALSLPYRPRNGPFEIVEEVLLVKGMTREILYGNIEDSARKSDLRNRSPGERVFGPGEYLGIDSFLSVHGTGNVNRDTASLDVLVASGLSDAEARATIARREQQLITGQLSDASSAKPGAHTTRLYRIESIGRVGRSAAWYRVAATVIREGGSQRLGFKVIAWHEGLG